MLTLLFISLELLLVLGTIFVVGYIVAGIVLFIQFEIPDIIEKIKDFKEKKKKEEG